MEEIKNDFENFEIAVIQANSVIKSFEKKFSKEITEMAFKEAIDKDKEKKNERNGDK